MDFIVNNENNIRLLCFIGFLIFFYVFEFFFPIFKRNKGSYKRWFVNLSLVLIDTILLRLIFPILAVGFSVICMEYNIGLFNILNLPIFIELIISFVLLDFGIWLQHLLFHKIKFLWRFHKVHHSDEEVDFSTGIRFHPGEILISMLYKIFLVVLIGPAVGLLIIFEVVLNASSIFNHSNIIIPKYFDIILRKIIVTPNMHRIHHSIMEKETNSNFGFNFSIWDKIFGTYIQSPNSNVKFITGLLEFNKVTEKSLLFLLISPFKKL
tara:strand:- start:1605 stop:2402 length:798 start_codon:yes stop_codon:yes gene_type:complete